MLRKLLKLAVLVAIAHALYRSAPVFLRHYQFVDAVEETALFSKGRSDAEVSERVMYLAERFRIPLDPETIAIRRDAQHTYIDLAYVQPIEWLPSYRRDWPFSVSAEAWTTQGTAPGDDVTR